MRALLALSVLMLPVVCGAASAQIAPYPAYGQPYSGYGSAAAERQRYEMEQVRIRSAEAESLARAQSLETRLTLRDLEGRRDAVRSPTPIYAPYAAPRSLEQERRGREAATAARQTTVSGVTQIDDWLNRSQP